MVITLYLFQLQYIIASDNLTGYKKNTPFSHFEYPLLYCAVSIYSNLQYILLRNLKKDSLTLYSASTFKVQRTLHDSSTFYRSWRHETIAIPPTIHRHFIGAGAMESSLYHQLSSWLCLIRRHFIGAGAREPYSSIPPADIHHMR